MVPRKRVKTISLPLLRNKRDSPGKRYLRIPPMYWYLGLLAIMLFSIYLRAVLPWKAVFTGNNTVMFSDESDAWYNMMLAKSTVLNLHRTFYDPLTNFPIRHTDTFWTI